MSQSTQFSPVDAAWLHMEHPTNLMMITGMILFKEPARPERVREILQQRLLQFKRFRQRVAEPAAGVGLPSWEEDPTFNLDAHVHHIALPAPGDRAQLTDLLSDLSSTPLDFTKPLWQAHIVDNVMVDGKRTSALIMRIHHAVGDGTALVAVTHYLLDHDPDAEIELPPQRTRRRRSLLDRLAATTGTVLTGAQQTFDAIWHESVTSLLHPSHVLRLADEAAQLAQDVTRRAARTTSVVGRALAQPSDPHTLLKGKLSVQKRVAWCEPLVLEEVKRTARAFGGKVNDVLVAAMTGALRAYLLGREAAVAGLDVHAVIPVDLRTTGRALDLGNVFGLVFLGMPIGIADPFERFVVVKQRMDSLKQSNEAVFYYSLLNVFGLTPHQVLDLVVDFFGSKATTVFTNVVGPRVPLYMAGNPVDEIVFWVPQSGRLGMGISIYSYSNQVTLGVITDAGLVPDPERIAEAFNEEYRILARAARERSLARASGQSRPRCAALTKSGSSCRNLALPDTSFCKVHTHAA